MKHSSDEPITISQQSPHDLTGPIAYSRTLPLGSENEAVIAHQSQLIDPLDNGLIYIREQNGGEHAVIRGGGDDEKSKLETVINTKAPVYHNRDSKVAN